MLQIVYTGRFKKSFKKLRSNKNFKKQVFEFVVNELILSNDLDLKYRDHSLIGDWIGYRECHLQNDILLIYKKENELLILVLADIGSHSSLF
jgi:mRNA interferase YafQ